jgi:WXXGXW repeat (2 copies)
MKLRKYVFMAIFALLFSIESQAQLVSIHIGRRSPPPPPRSACRTACPGPDYIWHDGRWSWDDYVRDYVWQAGFWEYVQPRYVQEPYRRSEYRDRRRDYDRDHDRGYGHGREKGRKHKH